MSPDADTVPAETTDAPAVPATEVRGWIKQTTKAMDGAGWVGLGRTKQVPQHTADIVMYIHCCAGSGAVKQYASEFTKRSICYQIFYITSSDKSDLEGKARNCRGRRREGHR